MASIQPRQNQLGVGGWVWAGKYKLERYLFILHRVTGLGLLLFLIFHLIATTIFRMQGQGVWEATVGLLENQWFKIGEYIVCVGFVFHTINGFRLLLQELGFTLGRPKPPIYPFKDSIRRRRPITIVMILIIFALCVLFLYDFVAGGW